MSDYADAGRAAFPNGLTEPRPAWNWPARDLNRRPKPDGDNGKSISRRSCLPNLVHTLTVWRKRIQERRQLAALDERMLRDIGLTRADAFQECRKHFWQP